MEIKQEFTIAAPLDKVWPVLIDVERVVPSLPGASLDSFEGENFAGGISVKLGPVHLKYGGEGTMRHDDLAKSIEVVGRGSELRGGGTAAATITASMTPRSDGQTHVSMFMNLDLAGKPAQFGRGILVEVTSKLIATFVTRLEAQILAGDEFEPPLPGEEDTVNVLSLGGSALLKRAAPVIAGAVAGALVALIVRNLRNR